MNYKEIKLIEEVINNEGFEYGIADYANFKSGYFEITDERFHLLREAYLEAKKDLEVYLVDLGIEW